MLAADGYCSTVVAENQPHCLALRPQSTSEPVLLGFDSADDLSVWLNALSAPDAVHASADRQRARSEELRLKRAAVKEETAILKMKVADKKREALRLHEQIGGFFKGHSAGETAGAPLPERSH